VICSRDEIRRRIAAAMLAGQDLETAVHAVAVELHLNPCDVRVIVYAAAA